MGHHRLIGSLTGNAFDDVTEVEQDAVRVVFGNGYKDVGDLAEDFHFDGFCPFITDDAHFQEFEFRNVGRGNVAKIWV